MHHKLVGLLKDRNASFKIAMILDNKSNKYEYIALSEKIHDREIFAEIFKKHYENTVIIIESKKENTNKKMELISTLFQTPEINLEVDEVGTFFNRTQFYMELESENLKART